MYNTLISVGHNSAAGIEMVDKSDKLLTIGAMILGRSVGEIVYEKYKHHLVDYLPKEKRPPIPLFVDPDDPSRTSAKAGKAGAAWLREIIANGGNKADYLNPEHPRCEHYKEEYRKETEKKAKEAADAASTAEDAS